MSSTRATALMKFLSALARRMGVAEHVYVVGGAVRNHLMGEAPKDVDLVVDSIALGGGKTADWFAQQVARVIPVATNLTTNQYGVAILTVKEDWFPEGEDGPNLVGEQIEIANARKESYDGAGGKGMGYKPTDVSPATITEDVYRREFTFNTLLWRLLDLAEGPDKAEIIDITGLGRQHLEERLIQTPLDPDKTFSDDPTRMLRILKFMLRYNLKISPEVEASVKRNAHKLKNMPWEPVGNILVDNILSSRNARRGLVVLRDLGLLQVLVEMIQANKPFSAFLTKQLGNGNHPMELLLDLADVNIDLKTLGFLTAAQKEEFREIVSEADPAWARALFEALRTPQIHSMALIEEFHLEGRDRGILTPMAREELLKNPSLMSDADSLTLAVRQRVQARRVASRFPG